MNWNTRDKLWMAVFSLALLYLAQGIPFGFATEYLPVVLREQDEARNWLHEAGRAMKRPRPVRPTGSCSATSPAAAKQARISSVVNRPSSWISEA